MTKIDISPVKMLAMGVVQSAFFARLRVIGEAAITTGRPVVSVYAPTDEEYEAVMVYLTKHSIIPSSEIVLAGDPNGDEPA